VGWHAIAADQRGYGGSTRKREVGFYSVNKIAADNVGLVDVLVGKTEKAVFIGHDWGSNIVWALLRMFPERVSASIIASIP
jgi:pimeloyl-ACP methyl ester carboxylesterase